MASPEASSNEEMSVEEQIAYSTAFDYVATELDRLGVTGDEFERCLREGIDYYYGQEHPIPDQQPEQ